MNYLAARRTRPFQKAKKPLSFIDILNIIKTMLQLMYEMVISYPLFILNQFGINLLPNIFLSNIPLWSLCLGGIFLGVTTSTAIGLGVGIGVGLNCAKSVSNYSNITNTTIFNTTATTITTLVNSTTLASG
jgi:hypothetical protein